MKMFSNDGKLNFVDANNVLVGFDNSQNCCEHFGTFFSLTVPTKIDEGKLEATEEFLEGYNFDGSFFQKIESSSEFDCGGMVTFRLYNEAKQALYLSLFNAHNGYYGHGFHMEIGGIKVHDSGL